MQDKRTAIVLGATGLVGGHLVRQLFADPRCERVLSLGRRRSGLEHEKLEERVIDFDAPETWRDSVRGDVLFSALGTTLKQAGSQAAQHKVDYTYQLRVAEAAVHGGVSTYVLVSAAGATPQSLLFYSRMKGQLERDVSALGFDRVCVLRPGLLAGKRAEKRTREQLGVAALRLLPAWSALAPVRPIEAASVARAALEIGLSSSPTTRPSTTARLSLLPGAGVGAEVYEARDLFRLGAS